MSERHDNIREASSISSLPTIIATIENMHATCWRQNINPYKMRPMCLSEVCRKNRENQLCSQIYKDMMYQCVCERQREVQ